jgi:hypothetical protein
VDVSTIGVESLGAVMPLIDRLTNK